MVPHPDPRQPPPPAVPHHPTSVHAPSTSNSNPENPRSSPHRFPPSLPSSALPPPPPPPPSDPISDSRASAATITTSSLPTLPIPPQSSSAAAAHPPPPPPAESPIHLPPNPSIIPHTPSSSYPPVTSPSPSIPAINHHPAAPNSNQLSYAQVARGPRGPGFVRAHASNIESFARLPRTGVNIICGSREGIPSFSFVNSDLPKVEELYSTTLVMKFHGGRPSLETSHKEISSWGIDHPFSIGPLSSRAFLLRFQDEKDLLKVLSRPSTTLITFPYRIFRWHSLCHIKEDSCFAPVWISLPKLPLQCFVPEFLEAVANKIGRFLCIDKATATLARPSAARLCVEIDLRKPPPQFIWVGLFEGFKQPILYEKMPKFCNGCQIQGHSNVECSRTPLDNHQLQTNRRPMPQPASTQPARQNAAANPKSHKSATTDRPNTRTASGPAHSTPKLPVNDQRRADAQNLSNIPPATVRSMEPNQPTYPQSTLNPSSQHANTSSPKDNQPPISLPPPTETTTLHYPTSNQFAALTPPDIAATCNPPASSRHRSHRKAHHKPIPSRPKLKFKQKRKSAASAPQQSNLVANQEFWKAVNRQMATIDQERTKASTIDASTSPMSSFTPEGTNPLPQPEGTQASPLSEDPGVASAEEADPRSHSPGESRQDSQNLYAPSNYASYDSEGEEPSAEPSPLQGHNTDDMLLSRHQNSRRNKRHPDQPLKVQLRGRKDPNPNL